MAKYTIDEKADILKRSLEAEKKAKRYGGEEAAYKAFEDRSSGSLKERYTAGREATKHMANMAEAEAEALKVRATNSREQYLHEKAQGDPNATQMSFEDWKKL